MKIPIRTVAVCAVLGAAINLNAQTFTVDPTQNWIGYMNVFELPQHGGGYDFGSPWATSALDAYFTGPTLTLTPNSNIDATDPIDSYWWQAPNDGTSPGNHIMAASMYVEDDNFAGGTVSFTGNVLDNTLVSPYTSVAFIDDFTPGYSLVNTITTPLVDGVFNISLGITPGDILQYGFVTTGPNARVADLASLGEVDIVAVPEPSILALAGLGGVLALSLIRRRN
ncbi:MAG: PEP-CTERM sorting domain-containing protein [Limisphaerales bacterium]